MVATTARGAAANWRLPKGKEMFDWMSSAPNQAASAQPLKMSDQGIQTDGLLAGTRVASNMGWRSVEALAPGDKVLTFDNGLQTLVEVKRELIWIDATHVPQQHWSVTVPAGALNNSHDLTLMPEQGVIVESDVADEATGDPFAVIQARHLVGLRGITRTAPSAYLEVITLVFAEEQVVYAEGGALLHAPAPGDLLGTFEDTATYEPLPQDLVALVLDEIRLEDALTERGLAAA
jgi:hypothetical protein